MELLLFTVSEYSSDGYTNWCYIDVDYIDWYICVAACAVITIATYVYVHSKAGASSPIAFCSSMQ